MSTTGIQDSKTMQRIIDAIDRLVLYKVRRAQVHGESDVLDGGAEKAKIDLAEALSDLATDIMRTK